MQMRKEIRTVNAKFYPLCFLFLAIRPLVLVKIQPFFISKTIYCHLTIQSQVHFNPQSHLATCAGGFWLNMMNWLFKAPILLSFLKSLNSLIMTVEGGLEKLFTVLCVIFHTSVINIKEFK